jgi:hypothetical protein
MTAHLPSYPSLFNLGHKALANLFEAPVIIEEKVDGSQFSFGNEGGVIACRSKGKQINVEDPEKLFGKAVETVLRLASKLPDGLIFRGEYLAKPHHNTLTYGRAPAQFVIIYDIQTAGEYYLEREEKQSLCDELGLELVPEFYRGMIPQDGSTEFLASFFGRSSILGGSIEGIVIKPASYDLFGVDKKLLVAKYVREEFREVHKATWKQEHGEKTGADIITGLARQFATPARWEKAVHHLRDAGLLVNAPQDIGKLMAEVPVDVAKEEADAIKEALFTWVWPQLKRKLTAGLPEWYKDRLAKSLQEVGV